MTFLETKEEQNSIAYIINEELRVEEDDYDLIFYQQASLFNNFLGLLYNGWWINYFSQETVEYS